MKTASLWSLVSWSFYHG